MPDGARQRYWGEPFPVVYVDDIPYAMDDDSLPLALPALNNFKSSGTGEGPLANLPDWVFFEENKRRDTNTMPTHAALRGISCAIWTLTMTTPLLTGRR